MVVCAGVVGGGQVDTFLNCLSSSMQVFILPIIVFGIKNMMTLNTSQHFKVILHVNHIYSYKHFKIMKLPTVPQSPFVRKYIL